MTHSPNRPVTHTYLVRKRCGCPVASITDDPADPRGTATIVSDFIARRHYVERVPLASIATVTFGCNCAPSGQLELLKG